MIDIINDYFKEKKINACVARECKSDTFVTYVITLNDIIDLKKFNGAMQKELSFLIGHNVTLSVGDEITITYNEAVSFSKKLKGVVLDIGKDTKGEKVWIDFKSNPHWLVGGATGSGKSVFLNNIIHQLIDRYNNCVEFGFIDLKQVELYQYNNLNMNVTDVANDIEHAIRLLEYAVEVMNNRYEKYKNNGVLDIESYNSIATEKDKYFFIIIDELAELMLQDKKAIQPLLQRLLQLGRASGVYVICATQRPSADVINGVLKVNFTTRISFKVSNMFDSKTIINQKGAELLCGNGDGYVLKNGEFGLIRFQGYAPVKDSNIDKYKVIKKQSYNINYNKALNNTGIIAVYGAEITKAILSIMLFVTTFVTCLFSMVFLGIKTIVKR